MQAPRTPADEPQRLDALQRSNLLDTPTDPIFDSVCRLAARILDMPMASISLIDAEEQRFKASAGMIDTRVPRALTFCGHVVGDRKPIVVPDATRDPRFADNPLVRAEAGIRFYAGVPLRTADNYLIGTLCVLDRQPREDFDEAQLRTLGDLSAILTSWLRTRASAGYLDATTGIFTRQYMLDTLEAELGQPDTCNDRRTGFVGILDVAMPQQMHDLTQVMGYQLTEKFVIECINRLSYAIGADHDLYRIGMCRFGFFMSESAEPEVCRKLDQLIATLREPFNSSVGILIAPSATMGITSLQRLSGVSAAEHLRQAAVSADDAWESKQAWAFYRADRDARRQRKLQLLLDLPAALDSPDQLHLAYQPQIDLATGQCLGVEALLRWQHRTLGTISPVELVEAAEKTALMGPLTDWVLDSALRQCAQWKATGLTLHVAVNISAHDLSDPNLVSRVQTRLKKHRLGGNSLELEFTESTLIRNLDAVMPTLQQLHALGVSTAIDDFGTGYCNLSYLQKLDVSRIKIDRRFVQALDDDPRSCTLTRAVVNLAHGLGYGIVAEGVETDATRRLLIDWQAERAQGYLFSPPLLAGELLDWIHALRAHPPVALPRSTRAG